MHSRGSSSRVEEFSLSQILHMSHEEAAEQFSLRKGNAVVKTT